MFHGELVAITTRPGRKIPVEPRQSATAVAHEGLQGDHRCEPGAQQKRQVTLIEEEALSRAAADYGLELTHAESRRNLLTRNVPLNHLVGRKFNVGNVVLFGVELCEPCKYLEGCLGRDVVEPLRHRGGLRAEVVEGGELQIGDTIKPFED